MDVYTQWNPHNGTFWFIQVRKNAYQEIRLSKSEARELIEKLTKELERK